MKPFIKLLILFFLGTIIFGCEEITDVDEFDDVAANQFAQTGFTLLNEKLLNLEEPDEIPQSGDDLFPEADYIQIKNLFDSALHENPENALANFGMGVLEIASINYDEELWDMINDVDNNFGDDRLFNHQFTFLKNSSFFYATYLQNSMRNDDISIARVQNYIDNNVLPKIGNSLNHLGTAISLPDSVTISIDTGEEILELDRAEIYAFRATVYVVSAGMKMLTLYDMDMVGEDGGYDWIDEIHNDYDYGVTNYNFDEDSGELTLEYQSGSAEEDSLLSHILKYNFEDRPGFGTYQNGNTPLYIKADLENVLFDLQNLVDYISSEIDDQSDDIIQFDYILELNEDISDLDEEQANFTTDWQTVDDVIDWIESLLDGPIYFSETFGESVTEIEFTVDFSRLFDPGLEDLKDYVPLHEWLPEEEWIIEDYWEDQYNWGGGSYCFDFEGESIEFENVEIVIEQHFDNFVEPMNFLDESGNVIDLDEEMPYLPDYTFNGIFPDMTREKLLDMIGDDE